MGLSVPAQQREERSVRPLRERHAGWSTVARGEEAREAGTRAELQHVATSESAQHRTAAAAITPALPVTQCSAYHVHAMFADNPSYVRVAGYVGPRRHVSQI